MEFTVQKSAKDSLISLAGWVKKKADDPVHTNNRDLIADFLEKVVVVELKKLENTDEVREIKIDIPEEDLPKRGPDPATLITKIVGVLASELSDDEDNPLTPNDIMGILSGSPTQPTQPLQPSEPDWMKGVREHMKNDRKIQAIKLYREHEGGGLRECKDIIDALMKEMENPTPKPASPYVPSPASTPSNVSGSGNNHSKGKKRRLTDTERNFITSVFNNKNGNLDDQDCSDIAAHLDLSVNGKTPWQVTGFVSELHRRVAGGRHKLPNPSTYIPPAKKTSLAVTQTTDPKFATDPRKLRMK